MGALAWEVDVERGGGTWQVWMMRWEGTTWTKVGRWTDEWKGRWSGKMAHDTTRKGAHAC
jgi:hypothetical protein